MNSWNYQYLGKRVRDGYEYQYKLNTLSVNNVNPKDVFDYSVHPVSLTIVKRPLKEEDTIETSPMKIASVQQQKQKLEQQSYESYAHGRELYGKLGIPTPDGLGLFYSDFLESQSQAGEKQILKEIDARFDQQVQKQKNAAAQEGIKQIPGVVPLRELLDGEERNLHLSMQEDSAASYKEYGADGSSVVHSVYVPFPCQDKRCGICNNREQIMKESQQQKVASSSSSTSKFVAGSSRELDDISDYLFR